MNAADKARVTRKKTTAKKGPEKPKPKPKPKSEPERRTCEECGQSITVTKSGELRVHTNPATKEHCSGGRQPNDSDIEKKALRYLTEGRVKVIYLAGGQVAAEVQGSKDHPYNVRYWSGAWACDCEAQVWHCTHVAAVFHVTDHSKTVNIDTVSEIDEVLIAADEVELPMESPPAPEPVEKSPEQVAAELASAGTAPDLGDDLDLLLEGSAAFAPEPWSEGSAASPESRSDQAVDDLQAFFDQLDGPFEVQRSDSAPVDGPP